MTRALLDVLDPSNRVQKQAQYEAFTFSLRGGDLLIRNESGSHPEDYKYRVAIVDGIPTEVSALPTKDTIVRVNTDLRLRFPPLLAQ